jgi:S-adenosylmethionine synthetase
MTISIGTLTDNRLEMAERKGPGHPDTICDAITEEISIALCKYYLNTCGMIMHHNIDKALLIGGQSQPRFGGGRVTQPISLIIAGRATHEVDGKVIPVQDIAVETAKAWTRKNMRFLQVDKDIRFESRIRPGSTDLVQLFSRFGKGEIPLANDTSFGAGYYPYSALESSILDIDQLLSDPKTQSVFPYVGEDTKVMGTRHSRHRQYTIAIAMVDRYIQDLSDYIGKIEAIKTHIFRNLRDENATLFINSADSYEQGSIYLTVTGTSAESGDDGQVGRGNRINGLITPYRPMSLEAASGKNPVSHVGKIYNYFALDLSRQLVESHFCESAQVFIVSQIGKPVTDPHGLHVRLKNRSVGKDMIEDFCRTSLSGLPEYWKRIVYQKADQGR